MIIGKFDNPSGRNQPVPPRDLADFHLRWSEFRPSILEILKVPGLRPEMIDALGWLIALSDRVSADDIGLKPR